MKALLLDLFEVFFPITIFFGIIGTGLGSIWLMERIGWLT